MRFKRKYLLRIALNPNIAESPPVLKINQGSSAGTILPVTQGDVCSIPDDLHEDAIGFHNHQMTANITYSRDKTNTATIVLYNVSRETQRKIKPDSIIILQAGYEEDEELPYIYAGQIVQVLPSKTNADRMLKLVCGSGVVVQRNLRMSHTFTPGSSYRAIINRIIQEIQKYGIPLGEFRATPQNQPKNIPSGVPASRLDLIPSSFSIEGNLFTSLERVLDMVGFHYYTMHGKLYIEPAELGAGLVKTVIDDGQIINNIEPKQESGGSLSGDNKNKSGLKVSTLLNGEFHLDSFIELTNEDYAGVYNPETISHALNYEGNEWFTTLNLTEASVE